MRIGSGWKKQSQNGKDYISVSIDIPLLGNLSFAIFREEEKKSENSPDYAIVWSPRKPASSTDEEITF